MSKISDIYSAIISKIGTTLPTFQRVPNPYSLDENTAILLKKAFGLSIGTGVNTERYVGCLTTWSRQFTIGLVTQVVNTENDTLGRAQVELDLIESHKAILSAFESDPTIGGVCIKAVITGDEGIDYIQGAQAKYLALELGLAVEYQETIA